MILKKQPNVDAMADSRRLPIQFGSGQSLSNIAWPWMSPQMEKATGLLPPAARKRPVPRSGGHPPTIVDANPENPEVEVSLNPFPLGVHAPELRRQMDIEQAELRMQLPGLSFAPWPALTKTFKSTTTNQVFTLNIPDTAQLLRFQFTSPAFVSRYPFAMPFVGDASDNFTDPVVIPNCEWFYCAGLRQLYMGLSAIGDAASAMFYITQ